MESELIANLRSLAAAYSAALGGVATSTIWKSAANDAWFFARIDRGKGSFTIKKYDEVVRWFSENWPETAEWPIDVTRPVHAGDVA